MPFDFSIQDYDDQYKDALMDISLPWLEGNDLLEPADIDQLTHPERVLAAEYIREQLLRRLNQEVPHGIAVAVEAFRERNDGLLDMEAIIYCEKESHKGIVIGKRGEMLKKVGSGARAEMEAFFGCRVNLQLWVKVKEDWRNRQGLIHHFGLD